MQLMRSIQSSAEISPGAIDPPARERKANQALIELLANYFYIKQASIYHLRLAQYLLSQSPVKSYAEISDLKVHPRKTEDEQEATSPSIALFMVKKSEVFEFFLQVDKYRAGLDIQLTHEVLRRYSVKIDSQVETRPEPERRFIQIPLGETSRREQSSGSGDRSARLALSKP